MNIAWLRGSVVPVESFRRDRIDRSPPVPTPDAGRRWGRPSAFAHSEERRATGADQPGVTMELPEDEPAHYMRIIPAELSVQFETVLVEGDDGTALAVDRLKRMMFRYTELLPKPTPSWPQVSRTTYFDLEFDLHPGPETEA